MSLVIISFPQGREHTRNSKLAISFGMAVLSTSVNTGYLTSSLKDLQSVYQNNKRSDGWVRVSRHGDGEVGIWFANGMGS